MHSVLFVNLITSSTAKKFFHLMTKVRRGDKEDVETGNRIDVKEKNRDDTKEKRGRRDILIASVNDHSGEVDVLHTVWNIRTDQGDKFQQQHARDLFIHFHLSMSRPLFLKNSNLSIGQSTEDDQKSNGKYTIETDNHHIEIISRIGERMNDAITSYRSIVIDRNGNTV